MNQLLRGLLLVATVITLSLPLLSLAAETQSIDELAREAEATPPLIPHKIGVDTNGEACLVCHKGGANGAPITPHAMRLNCTQCHLPKVAVGQKSAPTKKSSKK
jgi:nitrate reductase cytochrome c-type subunit